MATVAQLKPEIMRTLPGDAVRQIQWRFADRYELQMLVQSARAVARGHSTDAAAVEALCRATCATVVLAPGTSRFSRVIPGVAHRLKGRADTHITSLSATEGFAASRWFYRQRIEATIQRTARPWFLLLDVGSRAPWQGVAGQAHVEMVPVSLPAIRTNLSGVRAPKSDQQTIRPDAKLLFVAGAGWTKKQRDGQIHAEDAENLITQFLRESGASLGSSKSLVEQSGENQAVLKFMSHLNQVGQTGSTPRHPEGSPPVATARNRTLSAGDSFTSAAPSTSIPIVAGLAAKPTSSTSLTRSK